jgi:hypothetical protein
MLMVVPFMLESLERVITHRFLPPFSPGVCPWDSLGPMVRRESNDMPTMSPLILREMASAWI